MDDLYLLKYKKYKKKYINLKGGGTGSISVDTINKIKKCKTIQFVVHKKNTFGLDKETIVNDLNKIFQDNTPRKRLCINIYTSKKDPEVKLAVLHIYSYTNAIRGFACSDNN